MHQQRLAELAQNLQWRREAGWWLLAASVAVLVCYFLNWNLLWLLLLWPWYWCLKQWRHHDEQARMDWQFMHMAHPNIEGRYDSVFKIPVPRDFEPLEWPAGHWAEAAPKKSKKVAKKTR